MSKWFSINGINKEIKKIRWPKPKDLLTSSVQVIIFTLFFGLFFVLCELLVSVVLKGIGVI